jgi:ADP-ribosylglycohydrolase
MIGLFIGDMAGSFREFSRNKRADLPLLPDPAAHPFLQKKIGLTDDSILACATAMCCAAAKEEGREPGPADFAAFYHRFGNAFPCTIGGYGGMFHQWLAGADRSPYRSFGNGSAMRVGPVVHFASTIEQCLSLAAASAAATHDHPEGIKGARMTAGMAWLYAHGEGDPETVLRERWGISYGRSAGYDHFDAICQETLPLALHCLDGAAGFEDAVKRAVTVENGDSDTLGAIVGTVAQARFGVPDDLRDQMTALIQPELRSLVNDALAALP